MSISVDFEQTTVEARVFHQLIELTIDFVVSVQDVIVDSFPAHTDAGFELPVRYLFSVVLVGYLLCKWPQLDGWPAAELRNGRSTWPVELTVEHFQPFRFDKRGVISRGHIRNSHCFPHRLNHSLIEVVGYC